MRFLRSLSAEFWLLAIASVLWAFMAWHLYTLELLRTHYDQYTHIISARLIAQSMTPGMSQLGFWAPLSHVLLMPFLGVPLLQKTGLGASLAMLPSLLVSVVVLYRLMRSLTGNAGVAATTVIAFLANPYTLFFSVTPMAEMLMIAALLCALYFFHRWFEGGKVADLVYTGVAISLACLSRFEAFSLVPVATVAIAIGLVAKGYDWQRFQANLIIFVLPAVAGIAFIVCYSLAYSGEILAYGSYSLSTSADLGGKLLGGGAGTAWPVILTLFYAAGYVISAPLFVVGIIAVVFAILTYRQKLLACLLFGMAFAPAVFVFFTIYSGSIPLKVPELYGPATYNNVRYLISLLVPCLIGTGIVWARCLQACPWRFLRAAVSIAFVAFFVASIGKHAYVEAIAGGRQLGRQFEPMFVETVRPDDRKAMAAIIQDHYDYGKILTVRFENDAFLEESGLPLTTFIIESNYRYFDQVLKEPWLFARLIVFPSRGSRVFRQFDALVSNAIFHEYYTKVEDVKAGTNAFEVYILNERALRRALDTLGYDPLVIPSLNPNITFWKPDKVYQQMRDGRMR